MMSLTLVYSIWFRSRRPRYEAVGDCERDVRSRRPSASEAGGDCDEAR